MTANDIAEVLARRGVRRLAHFTPALNLMPILRDGEIRSSKDLASNAPGYYTPTDLERFDNHPEHVCCSFSYPNVYYLRRAKTKQKFTNYPDWVCLLLRASLAADAGALFCPCNAATESGAYIQGGSEALESCWADSSLPNNWDRLPTHLPEAPTDVQAEVLIPGPIPVSAIDGIVVPDVALARELSGVLSRLRVSIGGIPWKISADMFDANVLPGLIRHGRSIGLTDWAPEGGAP